VYCFTALLHYVDDKEGNQTNKANMRPMEGAGRIGSVRSRQTCLISGEGDKHQFEGSLLDLESNLLTSTRCVVPFRPMEGNAVQENNGQVQCPLWHAGFLVCAGKAERLRGLWVYQISKGK